MHAVIAGLFSIESTAVKESMVEVKRFEFLFLLFFSYFNVRENVLPLHSSEIYLTVNI